MNKNSSAKSTLQNGNKLVIYLETIDDDIILQFEELLKHKNKLINLQIFNHQQLQDEHHLYKLIFETLQKYNTIYSLSIVSSTFYKTFSVESANCLNRFLKTTKLKKLDIRFDGKMEVFKILSESLKITNNIEELNLSNDYINYEGSKIIGDIIKANSSILSLNLDSNDINDGLKFIVDGLETNETLTLLSLSKNKILEDYFDEFKRLLNTNKTLRILNISNNNARNNGAKILGSVLSCNKTLKVLDLSHNFIRDEGIDELAFALETNETLETLSLSNNLIEIEGINGLLVSLENNQSLTSLDISSQTFKTKNNATEFSEALYSFLKTNQHLKILNISGNPVQPDIIGLGMKVNYSIEELHLSNCYFKYWNVSLFSSFIGCLNENTVLKSLDISCNKIPFGASHSIGQYLSNNRTLKTLDVTQCNLYYTELNHLLDGLTTNSTLLELKTDTIFDTQEIQILLDRNRRNDKLAIMESVFLDINFKFR